MSEEKRIVIDCPQCHRTIWWNSVCHHGKVPDSLKNAPREKGIVPLVPDMPEGDLPPDPPIYKPKGPKKSR